MDFSLISDDIYAGLGYSFHVVSDPFRPSSPSWREIMHVWSRRKAREAKVRRKTHGRSRASFRSVSTSFVLLPHF